MYTSCSFETPDGTVPVRKFSEMSANSKRFAPSTPAKKSSGMVPWKEFTPRSNRRSWEKLAREGRGPVKPERPISLKSSSTPLDHWLERSKTVRVVIFEKCTGRVPLKWLVLSRRMLRSVRSETASGRVPDRSLLATDSAISFESLPNSAGNGPWARL